MDDDPFLNPNLEATATAIVLAQPPRRIPPWAAADFARSTPDRARAETKSSAQVDPGPFETVGS